MSLTLDLGPQEVEFKDSDGSVFCKGNVFDIYFTSQDIVANCPEDMSQEDKYRKVAVAFNKHFKGGDKDITHGQALKISLEVKRVIDQSKKA